MSILDLTDGWLTDWEESGGEFKEWVRGLHLTSINHGWFYAIYREPVIWWQNLCHIISWVPVLWRDRDWDHSYLLIMMHEKLCRMRRYHNESRLIGDWDKIAKQILVAECALDRLIKDEYMDYINYDKLGIAERQSAFIREEEMRKQDLNLFATEFVRHVRGWWE